MKSSKHDAEVTIFTDGACSGNPGPGGWAYVIRHNPTGKEDEGSGGDPHTTNNKMEMQAVIEGLKRLKKDGVRVHVVTDSSYVQQGITSWIINWKKNNWHLKSSKGKPVKNVELWKEMDALVQKHIVTFELVKGHSGHPENERCDELAVAAYQQYL